LASPDAEVPDGPVGHFVFSGGSGDIVENSAPSATDQLSLTGGATWNSEAPACVAGAVCGDGVQAAWEQCDDGNNYDNDGCSSQCAADTDTTIFAAFQSGLTQPEAEQDCQERGGHLAWIHGPAENAVILQLCDETGSVACQIGAVFPFTHWLNGDEISWSNWNSTSFVGTDPFATILSSNNPNGWSVPGTWDDYGIDETQGADQPYICRLYEGGDSEGALGTAPSQPESYGCTSKSFGGSEYLLCAPACSTWNEAQAHCESQGGNLITISDQAEYDWAVGLFWNSTDGYLYQEPPANAPSECTSSAMIWIGLYETADGWSWKSGESLDFEQWQGGEPNNLAGEDCADLNPALGFRDAICDGGESGNISNSFICELNSDSSSGGSAENAGVDCADILADNPDAPDGTYWIDPDGLDGAEPFQVYCDMTTVGGGWTLVAKISAHDSQDNWGWNASLYKDEVILGNGTDLSKQDAKTRAYNELAGAELLIVDLDGPGYVAHGYADTPVSWGTYINSIWSECGYLISDDPIELSDDELDSVIGSELYFHHYDAPKGCGNEERSMFAQVPSHSGYAEVGIGKSQGGSIDASTSPEGTFGVTGGSPPKDAAAYAFFVRGAATGGECVTDNGCSDHQCGLCMYAECQAYGTCICVWDVYDSWCED